MGEFHINDRVSVVGKNSDGTIAFIGNTHFSDGLWLGIILDQSVGRNNGSYEGIRYFKCIKNHGIFARPCQVKKTSSVPPDSDLPEESSRKHYPNYLKGDALSKPPSEKHNNYAKKSILLKKIRSDITLKSTSIPFFVSEGDIKLDGSNLEVEPKPITEKGTRFPKKQQETGNSPDKESKGQACELKDMISKTSKELNEVKEYVHNLDKKLQLLKKSMKKENSTSAEN